MQMTGQQRMNTFLAPDHLTWARPSQKRTKEKIGGFGLMQKTALVKHPIASFIYNYLRGRCCAECLIFVSYAGRCLPEPNSPPRPFSRIARTAASCHNYQALALLRRCGYHLLDAVAAT